MASCYHCGCSGATYRRNVVTGSSSGTYYGKRTSYSNRTYTGLRSLCADCALNVDKSRLRQKIFGKYFIIVLIIIATFYFKY